LRESPRFDISRRRSAAYGNEFENLRRETVSDTCNRANGSIFDVVKRLQELLSVRIFKIQFLSCGGIGDQVHLN
jgi:hypothetical protein